MLLRRLDTLFEPGLLRCHIGGLDFQFALDGRGELILFALAILQDFGVIEIALFSVGLNDPSDDLTLGDAIPNRHIDRGEPAGHGGGRVDHASGVTDQDALAAGSGWNPTDYAPG